MEARRTSVLLAAGLLSLHLPLAHATILTFDEEGVAPLDNGTLLQEAVAIPGQYGDRVTATVQAGLVYGEAGEGFTPHVVVDYLPDGDIQLWRADYGDLQRVAFVQPEGTGNMQITLTADDGFLVNLHGFDVGGWFHEDYVINSIKVLAGDTVLFEALDVLIEGDGNGDLHSSFLFAPALSAQSLSILFDSSNLLADSDNIGIDNIRFSESPAPVPLPGGLWLGASALAALWRTRRRA